MKKILLTGGSGFIGRHAVPELLKRGYEVHLIEVDLKTSLPFNHSVQIHSCDLFDFERQRQVFKRVRPAHLLHFAWYAEPGKFWSSPENIRWVQASLELLKNFVHYGGKRAVFAGTCAEYDWSHGFLSEKTTPALAGSLYGICKNGLQQIVGQYSKEVGLNSAWGRIFFLYGPYEHPARLVPSVIHSLLKNRPARCTHGRQIRDFLHVEDVASAFVSLLESDIEGPVNIASGQPISLKEVVELISNKIKRPDLLKLGAIQPSQSDPPVLLADIKRLETEMGWKPKYDLNTGLDQTIEWWKSQM